jgi:hypothetical protein
MSFQDPSVVC